MRIFWTVFLTSIKAGGELDARLTRIAGNKNGMGRPFFTKTFRHALRGPTTSRAAPFSKVRKQLQTYTPDVISAARS